MATLAAVGARPGAVVFAIAGVLTAVIFGALLRGVTQLMGLEGVTVQAVAGALTVYLLIGLTFA